MGFTSNAHQIYSVDPGIARGHSNTDPGYSFTLKESLFTPFESIFTSAIHNIKRPFEVPHHYRVDTKIVNPQYSMLHLESSFNI